MLLLQNKLLFLKETAPRINLEEATLRQYVKRGKISSLKDERGRHMFTEKEIIRFKDNRKRLAEEIKDHFSLEELEIMGISKSLVIDGVIESKIVERKYYVHFKELKRYLKTIKPNDAKKYWFPIGFLRYLETIKTKWYKNHWFSYGF